MVTGGFLFFGLRILRPMAFASGAFKTSHVNQPKQKRMINPEDFQNIQIVFAGAKL
jgi:hypothetical protein